MNSVLVRRPLVVKLLCGLFAFGVLASGLSALSLLDPGGILEPMWRLNPRAHEGFALIGSWAPVLMAVVCVACASASLGLFRARIWGYWLAIAMLSLNALGDLVNLITGMAPRAIVGLPIVALLLWSLSRPSAKAYFRPLVASGA